jgi:tetratricopeptide (TPR) repeat protein
MTQLRKVDEAQELYEDIVAEDPSLTPALEALGQLFEKKREWSRWAEIRLLLAENRGDDIEAAEQLRGDALQAEKKIRMPELALSFWERALEYEDEPVSLLALAEQVSNLSDWSRLDQLISRIEMHPDVDDSDRITWLQRGGSAALDGLEDHERALELWMKVVEFDPSNKRTIDQIKKLLVEQARWDELSSFLGSRGDWADLVKTLEGQANTTPDTDEQVSLYFRAAEIWEFELDQADKAQRSLEKVLQVDNQNLRAVK